jgi:hypothetical protein
MIKSRKMRGTGHIAGIRERERKKRNPYIVLVTKLAT